MEKLALRNDFDVIISGIFTTIKRKYNANSLELKKNAYNQALGAIFLANELNIIDAEEKSRYIDYATNCFNYGCEVIHNR